MRCPHPCELSLDEDVNDDGWRKLAIERWSLESRGVPIYPQARYQLALANEIAARMRLSDEIRAACEVYRIAGRASAMKSTVAGTRRNRRRSEFVLARATANGLRAEVLPEF